MRRLTRHNVRRRPFAVVVAVAAATLLPCLSTLTPAQSANAVNAEAQPTLRNYDQRLLDALRARGLHRLAAAHCRAELERSDLTERQRVELLVELSQTLVDHALVTADEALYQQAADVANDFAESAPDSVWLPLLRVQSALVRLARADADRQQSEIRAANTNQRRALQDRLRRAADDLRAESDQVSRDLATGAVTDRRDTDQPSRDEWLSLRTNIAYQLAAALKSLAQSHAADSPDRFNHLNEAAELLAPLAQLPAPHPLAWPSRVNLVECLRLLADFKEADRRIDFYESQDPPPTAALQLRAQRIRALLGDGDLAAAVDIANRPPAIEEIRSADLDLARLETYLNAWRDASAADRQDLANTHKEKSQQTLTEIESLHGPLWGRRGGLLLASYLAAAPATGDLAVLVRAAESLYRAGQFEDAVAAYDRAAKFALQENNPNQHFQLRFAAATICHERAWHRQAANRFRAVALDLPDHARASEAHLLAVKNLAAAIRADSDTADSQQTTAQLATRITWLDEHLDRWPESPTADEARWLLVRHHLRRRDWSQAIDLAYAIDPGFVDYPDVLTAVGTAFTAWIDQRASDSQPTVGLVNRADNFLRRYLPEPPSSAGWDPASRSAVVTWARLQLSSSLADPSAPARVAPYLASAVADLDPSDPTRDPALALLTLAHARQARVRDALNSLAAIDDEATPALLELLAGLEQPAAAPPSSLLGIAELRVQTATRLAEHRDELDQSGRLRVDLALARALAEAARADPAKLRDALAAYAELSREYPDNPTVHREQAEIYVRIGDPASLSAALKRWRIIERRSRAGTDDWFRAKYFLALVHARLGNADRARDLIAVTRALHPDLGGPEWTKRFDELLTEEIR